MAGMIEKNARFDFTLKQAGDEIKDGKHTWIEVPCKGLLLDMRSNDYNLYGTLQITNKKNSKLFS